jgi:hypothetical protein
MTAPTTIDGAKMTDKQMTFQEAVQPWMMECFGPEIAADKIERNHRFFEEATEAVQANGMTRSEAHQLVDYTFDRPIGELHQEIGGVMVTLAALCLATGQDMHAAGETELARIWTKVDAIRAKQAAKPKHSPLPAAPSADAAAQRLETTSEHIARDIREGRFPQRSEPQLVLSADAQDERERFYAQGLQDGVRIGEARAAPAQAGEPVAWTSAERLETLKNDGSRARTMWGAELAGPHDLPLYAAPQPSQPVEGGETCKCRRLGDWKGVHHPLCDQTPAPSAVVLDDERAAFEKAVQSLTFLCRTETKRLDEETLAALDVVEDHLVAMRASVRDEEGELRAAFPQATATQPAQTAQSEAAAEIVRQEVNLPNGTTQTLVAAFVLEPGKQLPHGAKLYAQTERALTDEQITDIRRAAIEECWEAVHAERLEDPSKNADDIAYDIAVTDCENAVRALLTAAQPASGGDL